VPKLPIITAKELIRVLLKLGYLQVNQVGSHTHWKKEGSARITIPIHSGKVLGKKILRGIINDIGFRVEDFINLL